MSSEYVLGWFEVLQSPYRRTLSSLYKNIQDPRIRRLVTRTHPIIVNLLVTSV